MCAWAWHLTDLTGRDQLAGLEDDVYDKMLDMNS